MIYVTHTCRECGCAFIAQDYTHVTTNPPTWRYCKKCAKKAGLDYAKQKPWDNAPKTAL